nr:histidine kinase [Saprospiraceae bacterium]
YFSQKMDWVAVGEGLLCLYFLGAIYLANAYDMPEFIAMHVLLALGYLILFGYAIKSKFAQ